MSGGFILGFIAELTGGSVWMLAQTTGVERSNLTVNILTLALLIVGFAAGAYGVIRTRSVASYRDAASAHESNWRAADARANELQKALEVAQKHASEQLALLVEAQARPDMTAVVNILERLVADSDQRTTMAMARVGEMFDAQRAVLVEIQQNLAKLNGRS